MKNKNNKNFVKFFTLLLSFSVLFFLFIYNFAFASAENINCPDYYKVQNVQINFSKNKGDIFPGDELDLKGKIINKNNYPMADGYVLVRVGKKNANFLSEGNYIIDEFFPLENLFFDPNSEKTVNFRWKIPASASSGEYRIEYYFLSGKKIDLGGLPFGSGVPGGFNDFKIKSSSSSFVSFDKTNAKINGKRYKFIGNWPSFTPGSKAEIFQPIKNTFSENRKVDVTYSLYFWDGTSEENKLDEKKETVEIPAKGSLDLSYTVPEIKEPVYFLKITAVSGDQKSISNIRFVSSAAHPRLVLAGISKFPVKENENFDVFSCFSNTSKENIQGKVNLEISDRSGKSLGDFEYSGDMGGTMKGIKNNFSPEQGLDYVKLTAKITGTDGKVFDSYSAEYDCRKIDKAICNEILSSAKAQKIKYWGNISFAVIVIIGLVAILFVIKMLRKNWKLFQAIIFILFFSLFLLPKISRANEVYFENFSSVDFPGTINFRDIFSGADEAEDFDGLQYYSIGMTQGDYYVGKGTDIKFSENLDSDSNPQSPILSILSTSWTDVIGFRNNSLDYKPDLPSGANLKESLPNWQLVSVDSGEEKLWGYYTVVLKNPSIAMNSNNSDVVSCEGLNCHSKNAGEAGLTADVGQTQARIKAYYLGHKGGGVPDDLCIARSSCGGCLDLCMQESAGENVRSDLNMCLKNCGGSAKGSKCGTISDKNYSYYCYSKYNGGGNNVTYNDLSWLYKDNLLTVDVPAVEDAGWWPITVLENFDYYCDPLNPECFNPNNPGWFNPDPNQPSINLAATPSTICSGEHSTVSWSINKLKKCALNKNGFLIPNYDNIINSGNITVLYDPNQTSPKYTLACNLYDNGNPLTYAMTAMATVDFQKSAETYNCIYGESKCGKCNQPVVSDNQCIKITTCGEKTEVITTVSPDEQTKKCSNCPIKSINPCTCKTWKETSPN